MKLDYSFQRTDTRGLHRGEVVNNTKHLSGATGSYRELANTLKIGYRYRLSALVSDRFKTTAEVDYLLQNYKGDGGFVHTEIYYYMAPAHWENDQKITEPKDGYIQWWFEGTWINDDKILSNYSPVQITDGKDTYPTILGSIITLWIHEGKWQPETQQPEPETQLPEPETQLPGGPYSQLPGVPLLPGVEPQPQTPGLETGLETVGRKDDSSDWVVPVAIAASFLLVGTAIYMGSRKSTTR